MNCSKRTIGFLGLFTIVFTGLAVARASLYFVGENIQYVKSKNFPSVCLLSLPDEGLCSGTLVSPTEIYTAGHCFGRKFLRKRNSVQITCGGRNQGSSSVVKLPDTSPTSVSWLNDKEPVRKDDFAVVTLPHPITAFLPSPVAKGPELYFTDAGDLLPGVTCTMMGYGLTDLNHDLDGNLSLGDLVQADLRGVKVSYGDGFLKITALNAPYLTTSANGGDSGGPLFCAAPGRGAELLGTIILYQRVNATDDDHRVMNLIHPIWQAVH